MNEAADLVVRLALFGSGLRGRHVPAGIADEVDATRALTLVDLGDREEVRRALLIALKIQPRDRQAFDEEFAAHWSAGGPAATGRAAARARISSDAVLGRISRGEPTAETTRDPSNRPGEAIAYSPDVALRRKPFDECSPRDLAEMERMLSRWAPRWAARRSRRLTPVRTRGTPDIRRSFRRAVTTGGEMLSLARRGRRLEDPRPIVLCDTSGSMDVHARFVLAFALALRRVARRTEVFAFNTSLTRLTPWLSPGKIGATLDTLSSMVPDWSGGTRIGESLMTFVTDYQDVLHARSVVAIVSDGLDRGDTTLVTRAMRLLRSRARRVVWLNPLSGDPRYEPTARAMQAALPYLDRFGPAHNLESLERLLPELSA